MAANDNAITPITNNTTVLWDRYQYPYVQPAITYTITQTPRCAWCQGTHTDRCPDLKSVSYRRDGTVERVEFFERDS